MAHAVDEIGTRLVHDGRTPGLAIGIVEDGRVVYARGFGYANVAKRVRFDPSTQSYVGAVSRQFTAAALLLLQQDGKLSLGDQVTKYVPELTIAKDVTIRQLLQQTSGLPDHTSAPGISHDATRTIKLSDLIAAVNKMPLNGPPGTKYHHNNFNYMIAGLIVERVSGVPLSDYLQQHVFMPLIMNQTLHAGDSGLDPSHAVGYTGAPDHFVPVRPWDPAWLYGGSGIITNVYDLAKWDIGMPLLLHVDAVRDMFTASGVAGEENYGLGWTIDEREGKRYVWHNGELSGYHAMNGLLPDEHVGVIVLSNTDDFTSTRVIAPEAVAARVLDIIAPPSARHLDNAIIERAKEWLERLAAHRIDRTQLTPAFSAYLTDDLIAKSNFASLGKLDAIIPIASTAGDSGSTVYEFLVHYGKTQYHYRITLTKDNKVDSLVLTP